MGGSKLNDSPGQSYLDYFNCYPFCCLQSSFDKTAPNIQRRILKLMKNPQSQMTVKICSAECVHDEVCIQ